MTTLAKWPPETAEEFCSCYHIPVRNGEAILYMAVQVDGWSFHRPSVEYRVGETYECDCDPSNIDDSRNMRVGDKWGACLDGETWSDVAPFKLLEVAVPLDAIMVLPRTHGWVRCSRLKVLREVPEDEW